MIWWNGAKYGIPCTWMTRGWVPLSVDDYGDTFIVFPFMVRDWPYGVTHEYDSRPYIAATLKFHETLEKQAESDAFYKSLSQKKPIANKSYKKAEKVEKKHPPTFYNRKDGRVSQLLPGTDAFDLFENWWNAKPQDKPKHLKKLDEFMEALDKKEKDLIEHYDRMLLK